MNQSNPLPKTPTPTNNAPDMIAARVWFPFGKLAVEAEFFGQIEELARTAIMHGGFAVTRAVATAHAYEAAKHLDSPRLRDQKTPLLLTLTGSWRSVHDSLLFDVADVTALVVADDLPFQTQIMDKIKAPKGCWLRASARLTRDADGYLRPTGATVHTNLNFPADSDTRRKPSRVRSDFVHERLRVAAGALARAAIAHGHELDCVKRPWIDVLLQWPEKPDSVAVLTDTVTVKSAVMYDADGKAIARLPLAACTKL